MSAIAKIRRAGFDVALDGDRLKVVRASKLTTEQRAFLKEHKAAVLKELRQEQEPTQAAIQPTAGFVCCGDCLHSVLPPQTDSVYGWRSCGLGVADGGGFARADRRCGQFEHGQIQSEIDPLAMRIDELVAAGWATWNARAKAESEAMQADVGHVATATMVNPRTTIGLVELPADVIAAYPAQPDAIPIDGARYSLWKVRFNDGGSMTLVEHEPTCFADAWRYAESLTSVVSIAPMSEPV